jgi:TonB family protein
MKTRTIGLLALLAAIAPPAHVRGQDSAPRDSSLKIHQTVAPFFPTHLYMDGVVSGEVRIAIQVDASGRLTDTLVVAYTNFSLVKPTLDAVGQWTFDPAVVNGEARGTTSGLVFDFRPDGPVLVQRAGGPGHDSLLDAYGRESMSFEYQVRELRDLDRIPNPVRIVKPSFAAQRGASSQPVRVTVDFYIDETGRVRMPSVSRSEDNALAWAAVQAVSQWTFAPPTVDGAPVTVHATQDFLSRR